MTLGKVKSLILVFIQFTCLFIIAYTGPLFPENLILLLPEMFGIFLAIYAIWVMRTSRLSIEPLVQEGAKLVLAGPYKWIRHPMYLAVLVVTVVLLINYFTLLRMVVVVVLVINLIVKIHFEEKLMIDEFPEYSTYMKKSWRIIPFIF